VPTETATFDLVGVKYSCTFQNANYLQSWSPPSEAGLYAVYAVNDDGKYDPRRPIYIGQTGDLDTRGFTSHHKVDCWKRQARGKTIAIAVCYISNEKQRLDTEADLIAIYKPVCNG
jgi:hypothetical protein